MDIQLVITAPLQPGVCNFEWQMAQLTEQGVLLFGEPSLNVAVTVSPQ
jgi:hypothetical protein